MERQKGGKLAISDEIIESSPPLLAVLEVIKGAER
jgi:hypothetical protein